VADDITATVARLEAALGALRDAVAGMSPEAFAADGPAGPSPRDRLWRAGLREDWMRRTVAAALGGRPLPAFEDRPRPAIAESADYLLTWLEQCHRPTLALLRRVPDDALDREIALRDGTTTPGLLFEALAAEFEETAGHVRIRQHAASAEGD
jgi:hypothetical protein